MKKVVDSSIISDQLPLPIYQYPMTFDNYYLHQGNREAVTALRNTLSPEADSFIYLWGVSGSGISHLLQSFQRELAQSGQISSCYLSLHTVIEYDPQSVFEPLAPLDIVCIDDLHLIEGRPDWQLALFHAFNRCYDQCKKMIFGANTAPRQLTISLADLQSRLCSATIFQLHPMEDKHKAIALQLQASSCGLVLTDQVAGYILRHSARDTRNLFHLLQQLNRESLAKQRKLTIPFVKNILENADR